MARKIQLRRGTAAAWTVANPILSQIEVGVETDTHKFKFGNGVDEWADLPYVSTGGLTDKKQTLTMDATDITNQYKDLAELIAADSLDVHYNGVLMVEGVAYSLSTVGGVTRVTFLGDLATGGAFALVNGSVLYAKYRYGA
jgi:hypothetical protein